MAQIPRYSRRVNPVDTAGTVQAPFSLADTGQGLEAQALQGIAKGATDVGTLLLAIKEQETNISDQLSDAKAEEELERVKSEFKTFQQENQDPEAWNNKATELKEQFNTYYQTLPFSKRVASQKSALYNTEINTFERSVNLSSIGKKQENLQTIRGERLEDVIANGGNPQQIEEATIKYRESFTGGMTDVSEEYSQMLDLKQKEYIAVGRKKYLSRIASSEPQTAIEITDQKISELKGGKLDEYGLGADEYEIIKRKASGVIGGARQHEGKMYELEVENNANDIVGSYISGDFSEIEPHEENIGSYNVIVDRMSKQNMDYGDEFTYNETMEKVQSGSVIDGQEMAELCEVLSQEQIKELNEINEDNKTLTNKPLLSFMAKDIINKYNEVQRRIDSRIGIGMEPGGAAELSTSVSSFKTYLIKEVRNMVKEGKSEIEIRKRVNEAFEATTDNILENWVARMFKTRRYDYTDVIQTGITEGGKQLNEEQLKRQRTEAMVNLIMDGQYEFVEPAIDIGWFK